ncbi:MAG: preprotein translocase subunit SecE [Gemmatimonadota bacterium]|jgi:preprotein translocase subunit SecE|nr:preprotein translocase subunit SecE [Gemmatimonadota bacterium]MDQ3604725.1 preprotein translocase subunit SecE [Gemmatimonadota bacterium]
MADNAIRSSREFLTDVQDEMRKVTWPDWPQLKNSTFIIIVFVFVLALVIFGMDTVLRMSLNVVRSLFGG